MKTTVSEKGQITIPEAASGSTWPAPGTMLDFDEANGTLVGRKLCRATTRRPGRDPAASGGRHGQAIRDLRGPGPDDPTA